MKGNNTLNELGDLLFDQLRKVTEMPEDPQKRREILETAKVAGVLAKSIVETEKVKLGQADLLMRAGLKTEVAGIKFLKEDADAHPRLLNG